MVKIFHSIRRYKVNSQSFCGFYKKLQVSGGCRDGTILKLELSVAIEQGNKSFLLHVVSSPNRRVTINLKFIPKLSVHYNW